MHSNISASDAYQRIDKWCIPSISTSDAYQAYWQTMHTKHTGKWCIAIYRQSDVHQTYWQGMHTKHIGKWCIPTILTNDIYKAYWQEIYTNYQQVVYTKLISKGCISSILASDAYRLYRQGIYVKHIGKGCIPSILTSNAFANWFGNPQKNTIYIILRGMTNDRAPNSSLSFCGWSFKTAMTWNQFHLYNYNEWVKYSKYHFIFMRYFMEQMLSSLNPSNLETHTSPSVPRLKIDVRTYIV